MMIIDDWKFYIFVLSTRPCEWFTDIMPNDITPNDITQNDITPNDITQNDITPNDT